MNEPRYKNSIFSLPDVTWRRFWSPWRAPGRSRALFLASRGVLWDPTGAPGASQGRRETLLGRSRDASGTLLGSMGCPERVPGSIFIRFSVPRDLSQGRSSLDFRANFRVTFASELAGEWHASRLSDIQSDAHCGAKVLDKPNKHAHAAQQKLDDTTTRMSGCSRSQLG